MSDGDMNIPFEEPDSFWKVLESCTLPVTLYIKGDCVYKEQTVLHHGQFLTILDRKNMSFMCGQDWNDKLFRVTCNAAIEIVEEHYPETLLDILSLGNKTSTYLKVKQKFGYESSICAAGDTFTFVKEQSVDLESDAANVSFRRTSDEIIVCLPANILINPKLFVFVTVQERMNLPDVTEEMLPLRAVFVESGNVPKGVVELQHIEVYDTIISATLPNNDKILYEIFSVDSRIKVKECGFLPKFIEFFGKSDSKQYQKRISEIKFSVHYDIYSGRIYGSVEMDNPYFRFDSHLVNKPKQLKQVAKISATLSTLPTSLKFQPTSGNQTNTKRTNRLYTSLSTLLRRKKRPLSDSEVALGLGSAEAKTGNEAEIVKLQKQKNDKYSTPRQENQLPQVTEHSSEFEENHFDVNTQDKRRTSLQGENPLYGYFTPAQMGTLRKSKSMENLTKHSHTSNETKYVSMWPLPVQPNEVEEPALLVEGNDSGIDSPDNRKSLDNIYRSFSKAAKEEDGPVDKTLDQHPNDFVQKPLIKPKPPRKLPRSFSNDSNPIDGSCFVTEDLRSSESSINKTEEEPTKPVLKPRTEKTRSKSESICSGKNHTYETVIYARIKSPPIFSNDNQKREIESLNEITTYTVDQVLSLVGKLKLSKYIPKFKKEMINGKMLTDLDESDSVNTLGLTKFEARKLHKFIRGWRPSTKHDVDTRLCDVRSWSTNNVRQELKEINLLSFATFSMENDVDGTLLLDLIENNYIESLSQDGVRLNSIEMKRLKKYIKGELEYTKEEKLQSKLM
ncbi:uncharacterized protein LOC130645283 [Hydractinia symbiolongicarpus]|uniref:uncharacterized protein LOC130645283 n=1 Tax=Hydractinia symbiolongicarpus TaxID=13093 RepID=UPI00254DF099|nr:uncharacterized protein LOC130645283 [Hydractinia symbiolongicarpus]